MNLDTHEELLKALGLENAFPATSVIGVQYTLENNQHPLLHIRSLYAGKVGLHTLQNVDGNWLNVGQ